LLVLTRKLRERILIGTNIRISVERIDRNQVRIGIEAPPDLNVVREELLGEPDDDRGRGRR
jgi:carbon storage regulator